MALAEAWHGVNLTIDSATMSAHLGGDGEAWLKHKNGVRKRNVIAAMYWDQWTRGGLPLADRAFMLQLHGFACTAAQLAKFAEDRGL